MQKSLRIILSLFVIAAIAIAVWSVIRSTRGTSEPTAAVIDSLNPAQRTCHGTTPTIMTVYSPGTGAILTSGGTATVSWTSCNIPATSQVAINIHWQASWDTPFQSNPVDVLNTTDSATFTLPPSSDFYSPNGLLSGDYYTISVSLVSNPAITASTGIFSISNPLCAAGISPISVSLVGEPASLTYASGISNADLGSYTITANCNATITSLSTGQNWTPLSAYANANEPASEYSYYNGSTLVYSNTINSSAVYPNGLFTLQAGQSKTIGIKLNLTPQTTSRQIQVNLEATTNGGAGSSPFSNWVTVTP